MDNGAWQQKERLVGNVTSIIEEGCLVVWIADQVMFNTYESQIHKNKNIVSNETSITPRKDGRLLAEMSFLCDPVVFAKCPQTSS